MKLPQSVPGRILAGAGLVGLAALLLAGLRLTLRATGPFLQDAYATQTATGFHPAKLLAVLAAVLILLVAFPLAILDGVSRFRYARLARRLRAAHTRETPYEGPEGRGIRFHGPEGDTLLLRGAGGLGAPRQARLPPPPPPETPVQTG